MHRRKSSKDTIEQENQVLNNGQPGSATFPQKREKLASIAFPNAPDEKENVNVSSEPQSQSSPFRVRVNSVPSEPNEQQTSHRPPPPSAGPYRTTFGSLAYSPPNGYHFPASPLRKSFTQGHGRTLSSSGSSLSVSSPMLSPAPHGRGHHSSRSISMIGSSSASLNASPPEGVGSAQLPNTPATPPSTRRHHHQRIHSRNLSVFFPRPGSLPTSSITEDTDVAQEATVTLNDSPQFKSVRLQDPPGPRRLGEGFTFGGGPGRTPPFASDTTEAETPSRAKRRGHHHKHSLSHNFFSFLEPGSQMQTSVSPEKPWTPMSPGIAPSTSTSSQYENGTAVGLTSPNLDPLASSPRTLPKDAIMVSVVQFVLGAVLWVSGQHSGSLACTGLGYWIVFDAFGVALRHVLPAYLSLESMQSKTRRPYGNARVETLLLFAQAVYLIFASVYVCKEAIEHLLLAAGDGHHHHPGDEDMALDGMGFPILLVLITVASLLSTCLLYDNHRKLIITSGHKLPSFSSILHRSRNFSFSASNPISPTSLILANPFTVAPLLFSLALLLGALLLPPPQQESYDLLLALFEAVLTFKIAYPAAEVLGTVLLQTAPPRGFPGARMEAFLRVMREIERHPLVLHLPAPHIWQLTPSVTSLPPSSSFSTKSQMHDISSLDALVVTLELHVRRDTDDGELLTLTRWAHDRCRIALGLGVGAKDRGNDGEDGAEITIGIVKG
ncbi:uncharacterized protein FOMMEDRAFT_20574 [Fomitiporia mediterranea MF3/22]|uniref:uncharacterized protein n=1 Tax=Fomitiporia mediterranea (strain MF3/22) TaxID=694068 RepID=UPI0004408A02|nr:uncharacterized protein FOMMEDRAFT_20574 [Fomitiporia mediterranea MF3/22]EJD01807.1 hypothetical protein FOMMEDRAFT_20574 [Fomitiporia mediterranea MF3/22]